MHEAACKGRTALFFPDHPSSARDAKEICARCPVRAECGAYWLSLRPRPRFGIWAGFSADRMTKRQVGSLRESA